MMFEIDEDSLRFTLQMLASNVPASEVAEAARRASYNIVSGSINALYDVLIQDLGLSEKEAAGHVLKALDACRIQVEAKVAGLADEVSVLALAYSKLLSDIE